MKDQHQTADEEQKRQMRAIATALLCKIGNFYSYPVKPVELSLSQYAGRKDPVELPSPGDVTFTIYQGCAPQLGTLDDNMVAAIVMFYGQAQMFAYILSEYCKQEDKFFQTRDVLVEAAALAKLKQVKVLLPALINLTYAVSLKLCAFTGIEFKSPFVRVAEEPIPEVIRRKLEQVEVLTFLQEQ